ncbi:hypothetical protein [Mesorhizobium retamae]|uniref:Uncharacterized protein n=1 Tax=Mesorhizobium retamae TaxID=2912854 RepID=A0ABS9QI86_9HYPH|nr:hypothetical protein [Mesorhizobium sp. IRAMC:0171]MCG7507106.1 hypothetical protein [Mesorhizobium sp. IRAMC:0171]
MTERSTHLLAWLEDGYTSCQHGSKEWAESYLHNARDVIVDQDTRIATLERQLAEARAERDEAKRRLFPYADATEICGYSTNGIYLIGDRKSIDAASKAFHYSAQIEEYRTAFNERIKATEAERDRLAAELAEERAKPKLKIKRVDRQPLVIDEPAWPNGCYSPSSCSRHLACMYINCPHENRQVKPEIEAAIRAATQPGGQTALVPAERGE